MASGRKSNRMIVVCDETRIRKDQHVAKAITLFLGHAQVRLEVVGKKVLLFFDLKKNGSQEFIVPFHLLNPPTRSGVSRAAKP